MYSFIASRCCSQLQLIPLGMCNVFHVYHLQFAFQALRLCFAVEVHLFAFWFSVLHLCFTFCICILRLTSHLLPIIATVYWAGRLLIRDHLDLNPRQPFYLVARPFPYGFAPCKYEVLVCPAGNSKFGC